MCIPDISFGEPKGQILEEDEESCVVTPEMMAKRLRGIERKLAERLGIEGTFEGSIRQALVARDRAGELVEDELVADWHEAYALWCDDEREKSREKGS
jgi:hypothetical protein